MYLLHSQWLAKAKRLPTMEEKALALWLEPSKRVIKMQKPKG